MPRDDRPAKAGKPPKKPGKKSRPPTGTLEPGGEHGAARESSATIQPVVDALGKLRAAVEASGAAQRAQYEQLLIAQRRTNHLLELALRAAFDEEELEGGNRPG